MGVVSCPDHTENEWSGNTSISAVNEIHSFLHT